MLPLAKELRFDGKITGCGGIFDQFKRHGLHTHGKAKKILFSWDGAWCSSGAQTPPPYVYQQG